MLVGTGASVGGTSVLVGTGVSVGGTGVLVGCGVLVGGGVSVGGTGVLVGCGVLVGGTGVSVGCGVFVGGTGVLVGCGVLVGGTGVLVGLSVLVGIGVQVCVGADVAVCVGSGLGAIVGIFTRIATNERATVCFAELDATTACWIAGSRLSGAVSVKEDSSSSLCASVTAAFDAISKASGVSVCATSLTRTATRLACCSYAFKTSRMMSCLSRFSAALFG